MKHAHLFVLLCLSFSIDGVLKLTQSLLVSSLSLSVIGMFSLFAVVYVVSFGILPVLIKKMTCHILSNLLNYPKNNFHSHSEQFRSFHLI